MITNKTIDSAYQLILNANTEKVLVAPKSGSLLDILNLTTTHPFDNTTNDYISPVVEAAALADASGTVPHDVEMGKIIENASAGIRNIMGLARTVINPLVKTSIAEVERFLETNVNKGNDYTIEAIYHDGLLDNTVFRSLLEAYEEVPMPRIPLYQEGMGIITENEMQTLFKLHIPQVDKHILQFIKDIGIDTIVDIYNIVFRSNGEVSKSRVLTQVEIEVCTFILASVFSNELPDKTTGNQFSFTERATAIRVKSGRWLANYFESSDMDVARNKLILSFPAFEGTSGPIKVNGVVYRKFLEMGGSPEVLIGNVLTGEHLYSFDDLLKRKDLFISAVNKHTAMKARQHLLDMSRTLELGLRRVLTTYINADDFDLVPGLEWEDPSAYHADIVDVMKSYPLTSTGDFPTYARNVITKLFWGHTNALEFLSEMDVQYKLNPELTPNEAATLSAVEMVVSWFLSQTEISNGTTSSEMGVAGLTTATILNMVEAATQIILNITGNELADTIAGKSITYTLHDSIVCRINKDVSRRYGV